MMLKNTSAKENRGGKETTRNVNETESEGQLPITVLNVPPNDSTCPSEKLLQGDQ
jgi:hypothetical protein